MADLFALSKIQDEILFRNDEYVSPEKAKAIKRIRSVASQVILWWPWVRLAVLVCSVSSLTSNVMCVAV